MKTISMLLTNINILITVISFSSLTVVGTPTQETPSKIATI